jgi:hypothetical protein
MYDSKTFLLVFRHGSAQHSQKIKKILDPLASSTPGQRHVIAKLLLLLAGV